MTTEHTSGETDSNYVVHTLFPTSVHWEDPEAVTP